jgi:periplasmic divalent cation tolerance protein
MPDIRIVLTTVDSPENARKLASTLVKERLAACASIFPRIDSIYRWNDQIQQEQESQLIIKTAADRVESLISGLRKIHPYEVPEILVLPVLGGLEEYFSWVVQETRVS